VNLIGLSFRYNFGATAETEGEAEAAEEESEP
jgi:hypothetical protein